MSKSSLILLLAASFGAGCNDVNSSSDPSGNAGGGNPTAGAIKAEDATDLWNEDQVRQ